MIRVALRVPASVLHRSQSGRHGESYRPGPGRYGLAPRCRRRGLGRPHEGRQNPVPPGGARRADKLSGPWLLPDQRQPAGRRDGPAVRRAALENHADLLPSGPAHTSTASMRRPPALAPPRSTVVDSAPEDGGWVALDLVEQHGHVPGTRCSQKERILATSIGGGPGTRTSNHDRDASCLLKRRGHRPKIASIRSATLVSGAAWRQRSVVVILEWLLPNGPRPGARADLQISRCSLARFRICSRREGRGWETYNWLQNREVLRCSFVGQVRRGPS